MMIGPELAGRLMTPEQFDSAQECDENYDYELISGVLVVRLPLPGAERGINDELGYILRNYRNNNPRGPGLDYTVYSNLIRTLSGNRRFADRVIWAGLGRVPDCDLDVPQIVVEFVSSGRRGRTRDIERKRAEYSELGIPEYWLIDLSQREMSVIHLNVDEARIIVGPHDVYETPLLPGFQLPMRTLLKDADLLDHARDQPPPDAH